MTQTMRVMTVSASVVMILGYAFIPSALGRAMDCIMVALLVVMACAQLERLEGGRAR